MCGSDKERGGKERVCVEGIKRGEGGRECVWK